MVVPKPPVVPARRIGEADGAIVAFDDRDKIDRDLRVGNNDYASLERYHGIQRQQYVFMCA